MEMTQTVWSVSSPLVSKWTRTHEQLVPKSSRTQYELVPKALTLTHEYEMTRVWFDLGTRWQVGLDRHPYSHVAWGDHATKKCDQSVQCDRSVPRMAGRLVWRVRASGPIKRGDNYVVRPGSVICAICRDRYRPSPVRGWSHCLG